MNLTITYVTRLPYIFMYHIKIHKIYDDKYICRPETCKPCVPIIAANFRSVVSVLKF